jgi:polyphosphate kinase
VPTPTPIFPALLDRDLSLLHFNARVLRLAKSRDVPLLERLRYLCIVSSNLDEFFEVRMEPHITASLQAQAATGQVTEAFARISAMAHELVAQQYQLHNEELTPAFAKVGIQILSHEDRNPRQRAWVRQYFQQEVKPLLVPVALDPSHPFPQVANKSLNFIVRLTGPDAFGRENDVAIVKVPRVLPRLIALPGEVSGRKTLFVLLSSVIRSHIHELFPGREMESFSQFRVTRHSDLAVDEEEVGNLRTALRQGLQHRHYGRAVRLEVSSSCSAYLASMLLDHFGLPPEALFRVHGPVNLVRLMQLIDQVKRPELLHPVHQPVWPRSWPKELGAFDLLRESDVLIHQPYESFDAVVRFLREAVNDSCVLAIKLTVYRTGAESEMMDLLAEAVHRGKEVTAVVELKARFDEEANINWAEQLERIGAQVVYGVLGLKTHAKMLLVTRREGRRLKRYGHLSTGNYNPKTAKLYTDLSFLTADAKITSDMDQVFMNLASQSVLPTMNRLLVAPFTLHARMLRHIRHAARMAQEGQTCCIVAKMNSLTDERLVRALMEAGRAGVHIDLIVRGACILPAGSKGCENIRVRSVIGRFLEHSRVFFFRLGDEEKLYLSSADWMSRNMFRRIELAWPVTDAALVKRVTEECLQTYLLDTQDAWLLQPDGSYVQPQQKPPGFSAQRHLMQLHGPDAGPGRR